MVRAPRLTSALEAAVGPGHVITDPAVTSAYARDWTGAYTGVALAVVRPATTAETAAVVDACASFGVALVPQGGNTGLVGGSVPGAEGGVVLSTTRMAALGDVDAAGAQVTVGAGAALEALQAHVRPAGFEVPVDLAARGTATIGGMVATNAGGVHVMRHGTMRRNVAGVEAVTGQGRVVSHLAGLDKDNTGYDLASLLAGSEGTLGVITTVRLRLVPVPAHRVTALLALPGLDAAVACVAALRAGVDGVDAAEYFVRPGLDVVRSRFSLPDPFDRAHAAYLLVEAAGSRDPTDALASAIAASPDVADAAVATGSGQRRELWQLRDLHTEAMASLGTPRKFDVTVPVGRVPEFVARACALSEGAGATVHHWGHLGDGNVHLNVLNAGPGELDGPLLALVATMGGSISAEHGIGRLKRPWLHLSRSADEIAVFRAIKAALDPAGILNPGVLLPDA
ncbi:MAG TPA: FAD-binding oxidoreductase [Acidimicrobiales bacterium]|nr:FAD-binding oxidoreductase [Acidimicrobiales bacterium]